MPERCAHCGNYATPEAVERQLRERQEDAERLTVKVANLAALYERIDAKLQIVVALVDGKPGERSIASRIDRMEWLLEQLNSRLPPLEEVARKFAPIRDWWEGKSKRDAALLLCAVSGVISLVVTIVSRYLH